MTNTTTIPTLAGDGSFTAYRAVPAGTPKAAIVVIQEIFGVNAGIRRKCDTLAEAGYPDISFGFWLALVVPAATPKDIVNKISADARKVLNDPAFRAKYIDPYGYEVLADTPEEFAAFYKDDLVAAEKRVKISGAKLD